MSRHTYTMPAFDTVFCAFTGDYATTRDGYCAACGDTGHPADRPTLEG